MRPPVSSCNLFKYALWFLCPWCIWRNEQWKHHLRNDYRKWRTNPSQYLKTDYPGVRTGMCTQLRCRGDSCLCKYALLRGLTPLHNSVPLLYREDTLTQRRKASERRVYFSGIPIFECSLLFSFLSGDFAEAMALEVCSWGWLAFSLHLKQSPQHPSVNSSSDEPTLGSVLPDLSLLISIVLGQWFFWSCPECFFSLSDPVSRIRGPLFPSQTRAAFCWLGSTQADYIGT